MMQIYEKAFFDTYKKEAALIKAKVNEIEIQQIIDWALSFDDRIKSLK